MSWPRTHCPLKHPVNMMYVNREWTRVSIIDIAAHGYSTCVLVDMSGQQVSNLRHRYIL